jgi:uncharacterized protein YceH (UPF0502 family)
MEIETIEENKKNFTLLEARVIACLMEKHLTTPNNYPLTINSLVLACNQKSNREPVMNLTQGQVEYTASILRDRNLAGIDYTGRAKHITHRVMNKFKLNRKTQAILTVLMLRAPQTLNEIKMRTNRMVNFEDVNEIKTILDELINEDESYIVLIPKAPGSREDRYSHTLCGKIEIVQPLATQSSNKVTSRSSDELKSLLNRLKKLEARVEELENIIDN